jgi:hypothetical protein
MLYFLSHFLQKDLAVDLATEEEGLRLEHASAEDIAAENATR